jgi:hypothetical protein
MKWYFKKKDYGCLLFVFNYKYNHLQLLFPEFWYKPWKWRIGFDIDFSNKGFGLHLGFFHIDYSYWGDY